MTRLFYTLTIFAATTCLFCNCSSKSDNNESSATEVIATEDFSLHNAPVSVLDSLALNADDLSPQQAVNLLNGYVEIYRNSSSAKTKAVTMRKFVDVYDILISNYGDEFRAAVSRAANEDINLRDISQDFRTKLAGYDEASGQVYDAPAPKDTTVVSETDTTAVADSQLL